MRKDLIAKIHIAKKDLGLDEDTYRLIIKQAVNKASAKDCTDKQLLTVLEVFKSKGWQSDIKKKFRKAPSSQIEKIYALWGELQFMDIVKTKEKVALDKYIHRMSKGKIDSAQWLDEVSSRHIIECLKKWIYREIMKKEGLK